MLCSRETKTQGNGDVVTYRYRMQLTEDEAFTIRRALEEYSAKKRLSFETRSQIVRMAEAIKTAEMEVDA